MMDTVSLSSTITIDRTKPFDPVKFVAEGWTVDEQDKRAIALSEINLAEVRLEHMLKKNERFITGEERLKRLEKTGCIRLDDKVLQLLWENQELIPELWKEKTGSYPTFIIFDGTVLRGQRGSRCVLSLCYLDDQWSWYYFSLETVADVCYSSAVLEST
jgi:hypothetical protein